MTVGSGRAPGAPGSSPTWSPGPKMGVGTAIDQGSNVWFTLGQGILNEVFFPGLDTACIRDLGLLVTDRKDFFSEERRDTQSELKYLEPGVPAFHLTNTCKFGRYRIEKTVFSDPFRPAVIQQIRFKALKGKLEDYAVFVLLSPHLGNRGAGNTAWVGQFKGLPMLFARRDTHTLALASSVPWRRRSAGFVGVSDGWQDVSRHKEMRWTYDFADDGNVALTGEVDLEETGGNFVLALGLGRNEGEAGHRARASLLQDLGVARHTYIQNWQEWQKEMLPVPAAKNHRQDMYRISAAVMRTHEGKSFPGGLVASLAVPWGFAMGDDDLGYHLVWPRDMIETVGALLAISKHEDARRVLFYFRVTQEANGHWPQNMWLDGCPHWNGIQLDETALVILLVELARREHGLNKKEVVSLWSMVRQAAAYLVCHGPVTPMDRWEEEAGYFASTMAVQIAALLAAADLATANGEPELAEYLGKTADIWNDEIDRLIYVRDTELAHQAGVDGYYVRFARPGQRMASSPASGEAHLKNHPAGKGHIALANLVSPDALLLVRFGLRAADDPRILNTIRVIDRVLKVDTPGGPCWHRYTKDGYGEHTDGSPFDGTGTGRLWPLLTGERAHYELAAGRKEEAEKLLKAMESFANDGGMLPEQIWDAADIPERGLFCGKPSGSAAPLVWAHAEYAKLRRSLQDGRVFDMPHQAAQRYLKDKRQSPQVFWRFEQPCKGFPAGKVLRLEVMARALVRWSADGWKTVQDTQTRTPGIDIHFVDLPTEKLAAGGKVVFTFLWLDASRWEGKDFQVMVEAAETVPLGPKSVGRDGERTDVEQAPKKTPRLARRK